MSRNASACVHPLWENSRLKLQAVTDTQALGLMWVIALRPPLLWPLSAAEKTRFA